MEDEDVTPIDPASIGLEIIVVDQYLSENHIGSDYVVDVAREVARVAATGRIIHTWCGPDCEALIVGYDPSLLTVIK